MTSDYTLRDGVLAGGDGAILSGLGEELCLETDDNGVGVFVTARAREKPSQRHVIKLGCIESLDRFIACFQDNPFCMQPAAGTEIGSAPMETQFLLAHRHDNRCILLVPLFSEDMRFMLRGKDEALELVGETADAFTVSEGGLALFVAEAADPYALMPQAAESVLHRLGTGQLRREKPMPPFVDLFGWCTWNAFYRDVSQAHVRKGLESLSRAGTPPRFMILDDGWLSERAMPTGEQRLTEFEANEKFPGGLRATVTMAKDEFGISQVIAWHAVMGYWGGVDADAFPAYDTRDVIPRLSRFHVRDPNVLDWQGLIAGVLRPGSVAQFYDDFHAFLHAQGIDGVKVDNQSAIAYLSDGMGGRVRMFRAYREAVERAIATHFDNTVINCMAGTTEIWYCARTTNVTRSSADFWPHLPESHGLHLWANACVSLWFSEFMHPDWDMFQSGHPMGAYHAAGRAVSGSPVYVADEPDGHDTDVLHKLVCSDGTILRCTDIGRPSPDCLFRDPLREDVILKIFNLNEHGAVLGAFHAQTADSAFPRISSTVSLADVPSIAHGRYAVMAHHSGEVREMGPDDMWSIDLDEAQWEIFTFAPLHDGTAVLGLADKYNSGGAISELQHETGRTRFRIRDGGTLVLHAKTTPVGVTMNAGSLTCEPGASNGTFLVQVPAAGPVEVTW